MKEAGLGNLGLHDREIPQASAFGILFGSQLTLLYTERSALLWVHQFISSFGGDPSRVTTVTDNISKSENLCAL